MISITNQNRNSNVSTSTNAPNSQRNKPQSYRFIRLIGEGSFGKANLVECIADRALCVIKTINIDNMTDKEKKETLLEAKILEKLDHPNIIKFREVFMAKKPRFTLNIVTDYADGGDLQGRIKAQKGKYFTENQILDWFTQICLALKHIHDKKILHRDLKSQNIFLTENGMIKLGDFGIAKCLGCTWEKAMTVVGTPYYLSPEIVNNKPYSFKSDIWALGVLLYEMAELKMPFDATSLPMLSLRILKGHYNPLTVNYSKELKNLIASLLVVDQNKRLNINEILKFPIIKSRIKSFLNEIEYNQEFSHTIIHNYNVLKESKEGNNIIRKRSSNPENKSAIQENKSVIQENKSVIQENKLLTQENKSAIQENMNKNYKIENKNNIIGVKPQVPTKRESDNREIVDFMKKNDQNKKYSVKEKIEVRKPSPVISKNQNLNRIDNNSNYNDIQNNNLNQININNMININENDNSNPLKELMKKAKNVELKNNNREETTPGKDKDKPFTSAKKSNGEIKFPKVVIVDKEKPVNINKEKDVKAININNNQNNIKGNDEKSTKESEEIYNLNRYLNELAKIDVEEEEKEEDAGNNAYEHKISEVNANDEREYNEYEEVEPANTEISQKQKFNETDVTTDNSQIEELKIELENSLGFEMFKKVYKIVDEKTDPLLIKCDFDTLGELISNNLGSKYNKKLINSAIDKIPEIFAIVVRERISNIK